MASQWLLTKGDQHHRETREEELAWSWYSTLSCKVMEKETLRRGETNQRWKLSSSVVSTQCIRFMARNSGVLCKPLIKLHITISCSILFSCASASIGRQETNMGRA
eukprot:3905014-Rhodomonas_salina.1